MRRMRWLILVLVSAALVACNTVTLQDSLTQEQANEIVAELVSRGISAVIERETGGQGKYRVEIKRGSYSEAMELIHQLRLPSPPRSSFSEMIAPRGLMPDSREVEALRLDRALAADLEEALQNNPNIASARVIVRLHSASLDIGAAESGGVGVSAVIRLREGGSAPEEELKALITQSLPGVTPDKVSIHSYAAGAKEATESGRTLGLDRDAAGNLRRVPLTEFLWVWRVPEDEYNSLAAGVLLGIVAIFALGVAVGWSSLSLRHNSKNGDGGASMLQKRLPVGRAPAPKRELPEPPPTKDSSPKEGAA